MPGETGHLGTERPVARRGEWYVAGLVALVGAALALPFLTGISMLDEGAVVHIADRIASGEVLYRDVATGAMPGAYYLHALLFVAFGRSLLVGRVLMIVLFALASGSVFLLARSVSSRAIAVASASAFAAVSVQYWRFPGYSSEAIVLVLVTLAAARAFVETRRPVSLVLTGLGIGAAILFKQNYGAFASLGVAAGLVAAAPTRRRALRDVAAAAIVAASPVALVSLLFALAGAGTEFWRSTVGIPLRAPYTVFARPWPSLFGPLSPRILRDLVYYMPFEELALDAREWLAWHQGVAVAIVRFTYYLPLAFLLASAALFARERARLRGAPPVSPLESTRLAAGALFLGTAAFLFLGVFPRVDAHHLFMVLAPAFLLGAWVAGPRPRLLVRRGALVLAGGCLAISAASQIAAVRAVHPEEIRDAFLDLPRARVWVERWQAAAVQEQIDRVERRVAPGEPIFVAPSSPMYYFLADRPNPTRYPLILPGALDEREVVATLEAAPVRYALLSDVAFEHYSFPAVAPTVWDYVYRHFRPAPGASWDVAPFAPYLYERGVARLRPNASGGEARDLVQTAGSAPPVFQIASRDEFVDGDPYRVEWQSTYFEPSLVVRASGGWRKLLVSWEVEARPGDRFELAFALTPWAWAGWVEGQGALVEAWVSPVEPSGSPHRVFLKWINPREVAEDRRWHRVALDLASLVSSRKAVVTLVAGPPPTFVEADATVAWSGLRLVNGEATPNGIPPVKNVRLDQRAARRILDFQERDLPMFQESARRYPELASAQIALAEVASSLGRHDVALAAAAAAVRLDPERAYFWIRLGQEQQQAGRSAAAIESMEAALALEPANANYHAALAAARLGAPDAAERAKADALQALELDSDNVWAWTVLAKAEERLGDLEGAKEAAQRSVDLEPAAAWPLLTLAASFAALDRPEEALPVLDRAAQLDMDAGARAELARLLRVCGQTPRARDEARVAVGRDAGSLAAWTELGHAEVALGRWDGAVEAWREAARLAPQSSSIRVQLARALFRARRAEEALEALAAAEALAGDEPPLLREVAIVLDELGSTDRAKEVWSEVLELAPPGPLREEARRRLFSG